MARAHSEADSPACSAARSISSRSDFRIRIRNMWSIRAVSGRGGVLFSRRHCSVSEQERNNPAIGDRSIYLALAFDQDTKLVCKFALGKRDAELTDAVMDDLARRIVRKPKIGRDSPQISTDGFNPYPNSVASGNSR